MSTIWACLNGRMVPEHEAVISVHDRGFLYGDGVFETLRAYGGAVFKAHAHIARLMRSARAISLPIPFEPDEILDTVNETLRANGLQEASIRVTLTRGAVASGFDPDPRPRPTWVVTAREFAGHPEHLYREGVSAALVKSPKVASGWLDPGIKSLNYLPNVLARMQSQDLGGYEGILLNDRGDLCEGTVSNLFWVREGSLRTPASHCGILEGITRQTVMDLARSSGIKVIEGKFKPDEILRAEECFLTSTLMELMPAVRVLGADPGEGDRRIGTGFVGPLTRLLHKAYRKEVDHECGGRAFAR